MADMARSNTILPGSWTASGLRHRCNAATVRRGSRSWGWSRPATPAGLTDRRASAGVDPDARIEVILRHAAPTCGHEHECPRAPRSQLRCPSRDRLPDHVRCDPDAVIGGGSDLATAT